MTHDNLLACLRELHDCEENCAGHKAWQEIEAHVGQLTAESAPLRQGVERLRLVLGRLSAWALSIHAVQTHQQIQAALRETEGLVKP